MFNLIKKYLSFSFFNNKNKIKDMEKMINNLKLENENLKNLKNFNNEIEKAKLMIANHKLRMQIDELQFLKKQPHYVYLKTKESSFSFSKENIRKLIQLCHPDKHGNNKTSLEVTQMLNEMKKNFND